MGHGDVTTEDRLQSTLCGIFITITFNDGTRKFLVGLLGAEPAMGNVRGAKQTRASSQTRGMTTSVVPNAVVMASHNTPWPGLRPDLLQAGANQC